MPKASNTLEVLARSTEAAAMAMSKNGGLQGGHRKSTMVIS